jgi:hypothetical protein
MGREIAVIEVPSATYHKAQDSLYELLDERSFRAVRSTRPRLPLKPFTLAQITPLSSTASALPLTTFRLTSCRCPGRPGLAVRRGVPDRCRPGG